MIYQHVRLTALFAVFSLVAVACGNFWPIEVDRVEITPGSATLAPGGVTHFEARVVMVNPDQSTGATWSVTPASGLTLESAQTSYVTVIAVDPGTYTLTATSVHDQQKSAAVTVTVTAPNAATLQRPAVLVTTRPR